MIKIYSGNYLIGKESNWVLFCQDYGWNLEEMKQTMRKAPNQLDGEDVYLHELDNSCERKLMRASLERGLVVLNKHMARQLQAVSVYNLKDNNGEPIFDGETLIQPFKLYDFIFSLKRNLPIWQSTEEECRTFIYSNIEGMPINWIQYIQMLLDLFVPNNIPEV